MWYVIVFLTGFLAGYVAAAFTWPSVRAWFERLIEHPVETIKTGIEALKERLRKVRGGP